SGVGSAEQLRRHGIGLRLDLPEVGRHLTDHAITVFVLNVEGGRPADVVRVGPTVKFRSRYPGVADDMKLTLFPNGEMLNLPGLIGIHLEIDESYSEGVVELRSTAATAAPRIESRLLSDQRDMDRMIAGIDHMLEIFEAMRDGIQAELLIPDADTARDPELLHEFVSKYHSTGYHPSGTCRIGHVVDEECRLLGAQGLWIADASVMPSVPRANTNLPTLMVGERVADLVKAAL
ncbi:MAG TPA: GMC family oxidoreductase, partial [Candidatus Dormibacteraeota bacterium]|nr:GMC family oxidoreductase [Candidatus Dormibacteraeota bacterium]